MAEIAQQKAADSTVTLPRPPDIKKNENKQKKIKKYGWILLSIHPYRIANGGGWCSQHPEEQLAAERQEDAEDEDAVIPGLTTARRPIFYSSSGLEVHDDPFFKW